MNSKKFVIFTLLLSFFSLLSILLFISIIDPYFHYHKPLKWITYNLKNQRYQNDGIVKHFDYDAIITGTSMTENFKNSEFDNLFNTKSIKIPYSGASFREINDCLITATNYNKNIKIILRSMDLYRIADPKDKLSYDKESYPTYLYDNHLINDVKYIYNKNVIVDALHTIVLTIQKKNSSSFDDYSKWYDMVTFSKETVDSQYNRSNKKNRTINISDKDYKNINENINQNIIDLAVQNPNIDFYLFLPPYSIYYWDNLNNNGTLKRQLDIIDYAINLLINYKNIHVFSFINEYDIITNLDNYKVKLKEIRNFYLNYNYDKLFNN